MSILTGDLQGLKKSVLASLEKLARRRVSGDRLLTAELGEEVCALSREIRRPIHLLLDEKGHVRRVIVAEPEALSAYLDSGEPMNHWLLLRTELGWHPPAPTDAVTLLQFRLTALGVLVANLSEGFSRSHGESPSHCDAVFWLAPRYSHRDQRLEPEAEPPQTLHQSENHSRETWRQWAQEAYAAAFSSRKATQEGRQKPRFWLIGVHSPGAAHEAELDDTLNELAQLVDTWGGQVLGRLKQSRSRPDGKTYLGRGKAEELALDIQRHQVTHVVADDSLSPTQQRNLEALLRVPVTDRTEIILDIFAQRARSREGQLQVELAQLRYQLPRLRGAGLSLSQQAAVGAKGATGSRGPGETQLEIQRRALRRRIEQLETEVREVEHHRQFQRQRREQSDVPVAALVGYTNAGKSTLMRRLTGADVLVENQLFATLDPTVRQLYLPNGRTLLLADTVGFIRKLPTLLVQAFRGTLDEVREADLILHVWDVSHPNRQEHLETVEETLQALGVDGTPRWTLCNKLDRLTTAQQEALSDVTNPVPHPLLLSATEGEGVEDLLEHLATWSEATGQPKASLSEALS
jgi:GTP-binding protein HflX